MSPEQAAGETVDARSDLWSLGVVTYEMLAGRPPFNGTSGLAIIHAVLTATPAPGQDTTARCPPGVGSHRRPNARAGPRAAHDHGRRGARSRRCVSCAAVVRTIAAAVRPRTSRRMRLAAAVVALVVAAAGVAWWAQRNAKVRWARHTALPEIARLAEAEKFDGAYRLAQHAQQYLGDDPVLAERMAAISGPADISSDPPGATVFYRPYNSAGRTVAAVGQDTDRRRAGATRPAALESRDGRPRGGGRRRRYSPVGVVCQSPLFAVPPGPDPARHGAHSIVHSVGRAD